MNNALRSLEPGAPVPVKNPAPGGPPAPGTDERGRGPPPPNETTTWGDTVGTIAAGALAAGAGAYALNRMTGGLSLTDPVVSSLRMNRGAWQAAAGGFRQGVPGAHVPPYPSPPPSTRTSRASSLSSVASDTPTVRPPPSPVGSLVMEDM